MVKPATRQTQLDTAGKIVSSNAAADTNPTLTDILKHQTDILNELRSMRTEVSS